MVRAAVVTRSGWLLPAAVAISVAVLAAIWVDAPGYTDADYYYATGLQLVRGNGFSQPFIWNYLAHPVDLPTPSHLYWMPLTSLLAAAPMWLLGEGFRIAQAPFLLLVGALPPLAMASALELGANPRQVRTAGWLACFSGFYLPFLTTTDTFLPYALAGGAALLLASRTGLPWRWGILGLVIGLAHLTRADGVLLLLPAVFAVYREKTARVQRLAWLLVGYLITLGPWLLRNWGVAAAEVGSGATRTLWLTGYDELFSYPPDGLTAAHLLQAGAAQIARDRLWALGQIAQSVIAVNGMVFALPFALWAAWLQRRRPLLQLALLYTAALIALMGGLLPFTGARGGYFHSSAALMPVMWGLIPMGVAAAARSAATWRGWDPARAAAGFQRMAVILAAGLTALLAWTRLASPSADWSAPADTYERVGQVLLELDPSAGRVAVNNPPGFWLATGIPAVVIPDGGKSALEAAIADYGVEWVVLDRNHPAGLADLYEMPPGAPGLQLRETIDVGTAAPIHLLQVNGP